MKKVLTGILCLWILFTVQASAATITAASCAQDDVQTAIDTAADGDTLVIPAGNCVWNAPVFIDLSSGKSLKIRGPACTLDGAGRPVACPTVISGNGMTVIGADTKPWRISNLDLEGAAGIAIKGQTKGWRIDHVYFGHNTGYAGGAGRVIWVNPNGGANYTYGVIDHCNFYMPQVIQVHMRGSNSDGGNNEWIRALGLGGPDAVYIEDCSFLTDGSMAMYYGWDVVDADSGARFVFRNNIVTNGYIGTHDAIIGGARSVRKFEVYDNTFNYSLGSSVCFAGTLRGGTGVWFNNTINGTPACRSKYIQLDLKRTYQLGGDPWDNLCSNSSGKAILDTVTNYPANCSSGNGCIDKDSSSSNPSGYPCRDQLGCDGNNPQTSQPTLFWNNRINGKDITIYVNTSAEPYIVAERDYCTSATTMPGSCNGVANDYIPYAHPHPLTVSGPLADSIVTVTSPNGGGNWQKGSTQNIRWTAEDMSGDVKIELYQGASKVRDIGTTSASSDSFSWLVDDSLTDGTNYKVWIYQGAVEDYSDDFFSINSSASMYVVKFATGSGGTLSGNTNQTVTGGNSTSEVEAVLNSGYTFSGWSGDVSGTTNPLVISDVQYDMSIAAQFSTNNNPQPQPNGGSGGGGGGGCFINMVTNCSGLWIGLLPLFFIGIGLVGWRWESRERRAKSIELRD